MSSESGVESVVEGCQAKCVETKEMLRSACNVRSKEELWITDVRVKDFKLESMD